MWRKKKLIAIAVLMAVMLVGIIGGAVLAADNSDDSEPEAKYEALLDRVCEIYEEKTDIPIDQEALIDAFAQAQSEMQTKALETWLQFLVEDGEITQAQANEYLDWWQVKPDVSFGFGFSGRDGFRGMGRMRGFDWP